MIGGLPFSQCTEFASAVALPPAWHLGGIPHRDEVIKLVPRELSVPLFHLASRESAIYGPRDVAWSLKGSPRDTLDLEHLAMTRFAIFVLLAAGCFNPKFQNGVPCSVDRECPGDQICAADDRCYDPDEVPDIDDAGVDASDDILRVVEIAGSDDGGFGDSGGHTCVRFSDGAMRCFGANVVGQLGLGNTVAFGDNEPANSAPLVGLGPVRSIGTGGDRSCAISHDGELRCWGRNAHGELGQGNGDVQNVGDDEALDDLPPIDLAGKAAQVCGGTFNQCARLESGEVRCFGINTVGIQGEDQIGLNSKPADFPPIDFGAFTAVDVDCGSNHACAVGEDGALFCWGFPFQGIGLGYPGMTSVGFNEHPKDVGPIDVGGSVQQVALGNSHTCALMTSGSVRCWGKASVLGIEASEDIGDDEPPSAAPFVSLGGTAVEIDANGEMTCARLENGDIRCWGFPNGHTGAPVGDNEPPSAFAPLPFPAPAVALGVGNEHACAVLESDELYCWGEGDDGRLGYGDQEDVGIGTSAASKGPVPVL